MIKFGVFGDRFYETYLFWRSDGGSFGVRFGCGRNLQEVLDGMTLPFRLARHSFTAIRNR